MRHCSIVSKYFLRTLLFWSFVSVSTSTNVFQGDCASTNSLCEQLCITISTETYECSCWDGHILQDDGLSCRVNTSVQYSKLDDDVETTSTRISTTTENDLQKSKRPLKLGQPLSFKGNNYAEFPISETAYLQTNITLQFKLDEQKDGIILFAGQLSGDDFISITLDGPNIIMRHDCGEGTIEDMYHGSFGIGQWHEINVWRTNCDRTQLRVDKGRRLVDIADEFKNYKGITMDEGVFIGNAPNNIEYLEEKTGSSEGIHGCIRLLIINDQVLLDSTNNINQAYDSSALYYCKSENDTTDMIEMFDLTQRGLPQIPDASEVSPKKIDYPTTTTTQLPIGHPRLLQILETTTIQSTSMTSLTTTTTSTSNNSTWKIAHFNGESLISLPAPNSILSYLELSIQFKTESDMGTLFFWKENSKFLAVTIEKSFIKVYASLGADTTVLRSENMISLYHWHKLEVWRSGKGILLKINRQNWVESELHGETLEILEDTGIIHIGSFNGNPPSMAVSIPGFVGCVKRIRLNGKTIGLSSNISVNVSECLADPCASAACPNNKCISHNSQPICSCQWPASGNKCGSTSDTDISSMSFNGFSYLELDDEAVMSHVTGDELNMDVNFKLRNFTSSNQQRQILLFAGDISQEDDFFELSIDHNRYARFSINLGSGTIVLTHPTPIVDEVWSTIEVFRRNHEIWLSVNGDDPISSYVPKGAEQLNVYGNVFVGNIHTNENQDDKDYIGLHGCIISLRFNITDIVHPKQAKSAINIEDCAI